MASIPRFIAIEGIDGAGTSTQCAKVADALRAAGHAVHTTREPSDNPIGLVIRHALTSAGRFDEKAMALLFAADRLDHMSREIEPAIQEGAIVLTDRYVMSSLAYQAELLGEPENGGWIATINRYARHADLTCFVDVDAGTALERRTQRGGPAERYDDHPLQERLVRRYRALQALVPKCVRIDGSAALDKVTQAILSHILRN